MRGTDARKSGGRASGSATDLRSIVFVCWGNICRSPMAERVAEKLAAEGILCKETHTHVIRVSPPLVISRQELDWALERFERVLTRP